MTFCLTLLPKPMRPVEMTNVATTQLRVASMIRPTAACRQACVSRIGCTVSTQTRSRRCSGRYDERCGYGSRTLSPPVTVSYGGPFLLRILRRRGSTAGC
jgi:hypothetical protein